MSRLSFAQKTDICCKSCFDHTAGLKIEIMKLSDYKSHIQTMDKRGNDAKKVRYPHDDTLLQKKPSQIIAYQDYYPLDSNGTPMTKRPQFWPSTKKRKQSTIIFQSAKKITIKKSVKDIVAPSPMARTKLPAKQSKQQASSSNNGDIKE
eukprot:395883_1